MKVAILLSILLIVAVVWTLAQKRRRVVPGGTMVARDVPEIVKQLQGVAANGAFAVIMFVPPGSTDGEAVNLQYSIEGGMVGLDWVLIGPPNIADKGRFSEFARKLGHRIVECNMNNCAYLRVTGTDIADLGQRIITDFYKVDPATKLDLMTEGFEWQRPPA